MSGERYAVYFAPPPGSPLAAFAANWFSGQAWSDWSQPGPGCMAELLRSPRRYGFHATLKAPFMLADGTDETMLSAAIEEFAAAQAAFEVPALSPQRLDRFLALMPMAPAPRLDALAADCVRAFDRFRAPPGAAELARRRAAGLSPRQEDLLQLWGYPYVCDEFRFHMTLTGPMADDEASVLLPRLQELTADLAAQPQCIDAVCLFQQPSPAQPFELRQRHAFGGS